MPGLSVVQRLVKFAGRRRTEERLRTWLSRRTFSPISSVRADGASEAAA